jgi:hypothetical protein
MPASRINTIEEVLLAQSKTAKNAGRPNLRGGRESGLFVIFSQPIYRLPWKLVKAKQLRLNLNQIRRPFYSQD